MGCRSCQPGPQKDDSPTRMSIYEKTDWVGYTLAFGISLLRKDAHAARHRGVYKDIYTKTR
jgi:hypothetical protein